jgi:hypothetical protein
MRRKTRQLRQTRRRRKKRRYGVDKGVHLYGGAAFPIGDTNVYSTSHGTTEDREWITKGETLGNIVGVTSPITITILKRGTHLRSILTRHNSPSQLHASLTTFDKDEYRPYLTIYVISERGEGIINSIESSLGQQNDKESFPFQKRRYPQNLLISRRGHNISSQTNMEDYRLKAHRNQLLAVS